MKYLIVLALSFTLFSCQNYQFGDGTRTILTLAEMHIAYCSEDNEIERENLLSMIRLIDEDYNSICKEQESQ